MTNLSDALSFLSLPNVCPLSIVALDSETGRPIHANSTFTDVFGPLYKFEQWNFVDVACRDGEPQQLGGDIAVDIPVPVPNGDRTKDQEEENRSKFRNAIDSVRNDRAGTARARNVEMLTMGNEAGLPIRRYFDWSVGSTTIDGSDNGGVVKKVLLLYGDAVTPDEATDRARDTELIDFFQNAPIALHWLGADGHVIWANQTELNVLGYTAEGMFVLAPVVALCAGRFYSSLMRHIICFVYFVASYN